MNAHSTHSRLTHLVRYIVDCDEIASDRLLLSKESMQVSPVVRGTSRAATVRVNWPKVVSSCLVLQVHLSPRDKCRPKPLQGRSRRESRATTDLHPWWRWWWRWWVQYLCCALLRKVAGHTVTSAGTSSSGSHTTPTALCDSRGAHRLTAVLVGNTQSYMSTPRAEHTTKSVA